AIESSSASSEVPTKILLVGAVQQNDVLRYHMDDARQFLFIPRKLWRTMLDINCHDDFVLFGSPECADFIAPSKCWNLIDARSSSRGPEISPTSIIEESSVPARPGHTSRLWRLYRLPDERCIYRCALERLPARKFASDLLTCGFNDDGFAWFSD